MNGALLLGLAPVFALSAALLLVMLVGAFRPHHGLMWALALLGLGAALALLPWSAVSTGQWTSPLLHYDAATLFFSGIILLAALAITLLSYRYLDVRTVHGERHHREYYILLLLAVLGALLLIASRHFTVLFLGLEVLSVALFGLLAYPVQQIRALEAAAKYLMLSGSSSALLLFGLAMVYAATGSLSYDAPAAAIDQGLARAGLLLASVGFAFKLSLVPFHMWTPDVYQGAPAPVTTLLAAVSKGAVAAAWWRLLSVSPMGQDPSIILALSALAVLTMLGGNLLALWQDNLKRLLAYSSVGHMGFWLVPIAVAGPIASEAAGYYLAAYVASVLAAFGTITYLSSFGAEDVGDLAAYRGLVWRQPLAALVLTAALLSLAGIPLTVGFVAKFYVFAAGIEGARWGLVAAVVLSSAIGIYYYLRVITVVFLPAEEQRIPMVGHGTGVLLFLLLFIVVYGVLPAPLMDAVRAAVAGR